MARGLCSVLHPELFIPGVLESSAYSCVCSISHFPLQVLCPDLAAPAVPAGFGSGAARLC